MLKTITKPTTNDQELVAAVIKKDRLAFSRLYDKYAKALFGFIYVVTNDEVISEHILQQSFHVFWNMASKYDPLKQRFLTIMLQIAGNLAKESIRGKSTKIHAEKNYVHDSEESNKFEGINLKSVFELVSVNGYSWQEVIKEPNYPVRDLKTVTRTAGDAKGNHTHEKYKRIY